MRLSVIALVVLAAASMAMAAPNPTITWTVTKVGALNNNNGSPIVANTGTAGPGMTLNASNTLYDVQIFTSDPTGNTMGSWALNIATTGTNGATVFQSLGYSHTDTPIDTQTNAILYDAPGRKNDNYSMAADTWLGSNFFLIGAPGVFTAPNLDGDGNVANSPNQWDLHIGTEAGFGNILVGQWCVDIGANASGTLQIQGTIARHGDIWDLATGAYFYDGQSLGTLSIPVPEPVSLSLLGLGSLALLRRRK